MSYGIKKISENVIQPGRAITIVDTKLLDNDNFAIGTLRIDTEKKGLTYKIARDTFGKFDALEVLIDQTVVEQLIKDQNVTERKIKDTDVTTRKIRDLNVTTEKINNFAVIEEKIGPSAVTTSKIKDLNVTEQKLATDSVTTIKIKDGSIMTSKIFDEQVTTSKIALYAVTELKLATNSVTTPKIKDESVTTEKIAPFAIIGDLIPDRQIGTRHLIDQAVVTSKLGDASVTEIKIADSSVTTPKIADFSITNPKYADLSITTQKLANLTVTTEKLANACVTKDKVDAEILHVLDNAVLYDEADNVTLKNNLNVKNDIIAEGTITGAKVYNMAYMDLAEGYVPGEPLEAGDVVEVRHDGKVYKTTKEKLGTVVGVVSDEYAACYGATQEEIELGTKVAVALCGKVHVKVSDMNIHIGDKLVANKVGRASKANIFNKRRGIIGKALEPCACMGYNHKVLCLVGPCI